METFKMNTLAHWLPVEPMSALPFKAPAPRRLALKVLCNKPVSVMTGETEEMSNRRLIAYGVGMLDVSVVVDADGWLGFDAEPDTLIEVKFAERDFTVQKTDEVTFTSLMPTGRRNTDQDRIAFFVRENERRRDRIFQRELERMRKQMEGNQAPKPLKRAEEETVIEQEGTPDVQPESDAPQA